MIMRLVAAAVLALITVSCHDAREEFDLVIRGGTIIDGTGAPRVAGDVAVRGDRIAAVGVIPGRVKAIPATGTDGAPHRVPHIGWNALVPPPHRPEWSATVLEGLVESPAVYFVHSFAPVPADERHRLADCLYDGQRISAVVRSGNVYGCQFHPEKSGPVGLRIVENFLRL